MTRVLVGPFNRVEGDLEVALEVERGQVAKAEVTTTLYRGFEQILMGRPPLDALVVAPRICGICSVSQSMAAVAALRGLMEVDPAPNGVLSARIAHAAENMADHLTHFYLFFMPDFARDCYAGRPWFDDVHRRFKAIDGDAMAAVLAARSHLLEVMGLLAGKWPHSLAFQPGGTTQALDLGGRIRLTAILRGLRSFLETTLFGTDVETVLTLTRRRDWDNLAETSGDLGRFIRVALDLGLDRMGRFSGPLVSYGAYDGLFPRGVAVDGGLAALDDGQITEDVTHAWMNGDTSSPAMAETWPDAHKAQAYSWAKAPRLGGRAAEVGAVARQMVAQDPLVGELVAAANGTTVYARVVARLLELAKVLVAAEGWVQEIRLKEPFCVPSAPLADGLAVGQVEAARGALGHWLAVADQRILRYQIIAPTTWNFSPRDQDGQPGPLEQSLAGLDVGDQGAKAPQVQHIVRSFDPCMVCTAH